MPKMKTKASVKKRFKKTGTGKIKRGSAYTSHLFSNKTQKQKRKLRKGGLVSASDTKRIKEML